MYKCLQYIKVNGRFVDKGEIVDLSTLNAKEISRLMKKGIVIKADESPSIEKIPNKDTGNGGGGSGKEDGGGEMTDEEVRAELSEKITHTVAVKELKLLGAEFKANVSLEVLVDLIMESEEYENHFLDYIENNEL